MQFDRSVEMPRPRFNNLEACRRRELLVGAAKEFALHGYQGASLNGIITGLGLSKGAFYYYFDDKADLFETVTQFAFEDLFGATSEAFDLGSLDRVTFWPSLERWCLQLMARMTELPWLAGLGKLVYDPPKVDDVAGIVESRFDEARGWLAELLRHGRQVGAVRDDIPLGLQQQMLIGAMEGSDRWFVANWEELDTAERDGLAARTFEVARRMVATDSGERQ